MSNNPVLLSTVLDLKTLGFSENSFKFDVLSLEGDRYVSIKDQDGENLTVAIIDMYNGNSVTRKPMKAEAAIMNPTQPVIALRAKLESNYFIQVFNLETKEKLGYHLFDQKIVYWKWLNSNELAVVTDNYVYHWEVGKSDPRLIFERCGKLLDTTTKLVGYAADMLNKWCLIFGIYSNDQGATIEGALQLYCIEKRQQQLFEGYAGAFGQLRTSNETMKKTNLLVFCEHKKNSNNIKLYLMDIYAGNNESGQDGTNKALRVNCVLEKSNEYPNDFPISIHVLDSNGLILVLTKNGFAHFYYSTTLTYLFTERISVSPLFVSCNKKVDGKTVGAMAVNRNGEVLNLLVDEERLLSFLEHNQEVCMGLATCYGLKGSDRLLLQSFETFFNNGQYKQAAQIVATLKSNELRTMETIQRFKNQTTPTGNALSYYFSVLLEYGKLNEVESLELVRPVLVQNRKELVKKWMDQDKLTESEQLGDLLSQMDHGLAFKVYTRINSHMKAIMCLIESKQTSKILTYIQKMITTNADPAGSGVSYVVNSIGDKVALVQGLPSMSLLVENVANKQPESLVSFVNDLLKGMKRGEPLCDVVEVTELLVRLRKLKELNEILLDYLKPNSKQHAKLQTRLLEVNLKNDPRVAETILQLDIFTEFDKEYIARLCEEASLYDYALQFYSNLNDLKRLIVKSVGTLSETTLHKALNAMSNDNAFEVLKEMLDSSVNMDVMVSSAVSLHTKLGALKLYNLFEANNCNNVVLFNYLKRLPFIQNSNYQLPASGSSSSTPTMGGSAPGSGSGSGLGLGVAGTTGVGAVGTTTNALGMKDGVGGGSSTSTTVGGLAQTTTAADVNDLVLKYLNLCLVNDEMFELERVVKDNNFFDLYSAKELLKASNMSDPKALMLVCNRLGCVKELVEYLYNNDMARHVEVFVSSVNPSSVSEVVATLLDLGTNDQLLNAILNNLRDSAGMKAIIKVAEERHQLMMLQGFLETRIKEGYKEEELHTCLMKIYITSSQNPEHHLTNNKLYNKLQVAKYCEDIDVQLSYLIYNENNMNEELVKLCLKHNLYKQLNQYLLKQSKFELYKMLYDQLTTGDGKSKPDALDLKPDLDTSDKPKVTEVVAHGDKKDSAEFSTVFDELLVMCIDNCNSNEISVLIKFLLSQDLNTYLITLLEGLLLNQTEFSTNSNLQNLLLATTLKTNPAKLQDYLNKLNNYEVNSLAKLANELGLYYSSYQLYRKLDKYQEAFNELVLLEEMYSKAESLSLTSGTSATPAASGDVSSQGASLTDGTPGTPTTPKNEQSALVLNKKHNRLQTSKEVLEEMFNYANQVDKSAIWFRLGKIYLDKKLMTLSIDCYLKSSNFTHHVQIKTACGDDLELLLKWLKESTRIKQIPELVNDLLILLAKMGRDPEFQKVLNSNMTTTDLNTVGNELMTLGLFKEAVDVYTKINNYNKLALCYVQLGMYDEACDASLRSKNPKVLKETFDTLLTTSGVGLKDKKLSRDSKVVKDGDFLGLEDEVGTKDGEEGKGSEKEDGQAQGLDTKDSEEEKESKKQRKIIDRKENKKKEERVSSEKKRLLNVLAGELLNFPEFLSFVVVSYENLGLFDDLIELLRRANKTVATSTELAIAIAKFHPELLLEHLRNVAFESNSLNISKTARECSNLWLWREAVFLYTIDDSDKAVLSMVLHPECFEQDLFFRTLKNVSNSEVLYKALYFCIQQHPMLVPKLLLNVRTKFDNTRLIKILKNNNCLQLAREYLEVYADRNAPLVNDTLYELLVEENNFTLLEENISKFLNYDHAKLCSLLEEHPLAKMRDIAAKIFCRDQKYSRASLIYLKNGNYVKAVDSARLSKSTQLVHEVVASLLVKGQLNYFVMCLVVNFSLVDPSDVLEMAWLSNVQLDLVMPFLIHLLRFVAYKKPNQPNQTYHLTNR